MAPEPKDGPKPDNEIDDEPDDEIDDEDDETDDEPDEEPDDGRTTSPSPARCTSGRTTDERPDPAEAEDHAPALWRS
jgi:hypothetical protein